MSTNAARVDRGRSARKRAAIKRKALRRRRERPTHLRKNFDRSGGEWES